MQWRSAERRQYSCISSALNSPSGLCAENSTKIISKTQRRGDSDILQERKLRTIHTRRKPGFRFEKLVKRTDVIISYLPGNFIE